VPSVAKTAVIIGTNPCRTTNDLEKCGQFHAFGPSGGAGKRGKMIEEANLFTGYSKEVIQT